MSLFPPSNTAPKSGGIKIERTSAYSDVMIQCADGRVFHAHMVVLTSQCTYLAENPRLFKSGEQSHHLILEVEYDLCEVDCVLHYLYTGEFPEADAIEFESDSSDAASDKSVDNTYSVLQMRADVEYALLVTFFGVMKIAKHWQLHRLYEWVRVDKLSIGLDADKDPLGYMTFLEAAASANVLREFEAEALSGLPRDKSKLWAFLKHNDYAIFALSQSFRIVLLGMLREWFDATDSENPYLKIAADDEPRRSRLSKYCSTELGRAVSSRPQLKTLCYLPYSKGFTEGDDERLR